MKTSLMPFALFLAITGCASEIPQSDLDFKQVMAPTPSSSSSELSIKGKKPEEIESQNFFDWQKYYRPNPSTAEALSLKAYSEQNPAPSTFEARLQRARNVLAMGYRSEARDMYSDLLRDQPENMDVLLDMAHLYLGENSIERSFDYLSAARRILDKTERPPKAFVIRYRFALSLAYLQTKNRKQATSILAELIEKDQRFTPAYAALSQAYLQDKKFELADFVAKRGLDLDSNDSMLLNILGVIAIKKGRFDEAKSWIDRSLAQNPEYLPAMINRAHLAMRRREYVTAENDLQKVAQMDPSNLEGQLALGILFKKTGRTSAAKLAFEKAVAIDPQSAYARYHLGSILADETKDSTAALQLFYDVLQSKDQDQELKELAKAQIQSIRDSRLYDRSSVPSDVN